MVESRPLEKALFHVTLIVGIAIITFPIFIALGASSHEAEDVMTTVRGWFGGALLENYATVLKSGKGSAVGVPVALMMWNSFVMSMGIVIGRDRHLYSFRLCQRLFSLSVTKILFLDHFYDLDAGGGSTHSAEPVC